jgi:sugar-specific transcriptional regulator TrmB
METPEYIENLKELGFSQNEAQVYVTLAKLGLSKAGMVAKYSDLDRSSMYNAMQSLLKKGLASYTLVGKTRYFQCSNTGNIMSYLTSKVDFAKQFLPDLEKIRKENKPSENVRLFKGYKGIQTILQDNLNSGKETLIFGSEGYFSERMPSFAKRVVSQMENSGMKVRTIKRKNRSGERHLKTKQERTIPSLTVSPVVTTIYGDKISIIIWSDIPEGILIENKEAAASYRDYYEFMWKHADK